MRIRRDDTVVILSGDEKGQRGKVLQVLPDKGKVVVAGKNYVWKHLRKSQEHAHGARIQREAPISWGKVMVICESCDKPTRVRVQLTAANERVRFCKKCGQAVKPAG